MAQAGALELPGSGDHRQDALVRSPASKVHERSREQLDEVGAGPFEHVTGGPAEGGHLGHLVHSPQDVAPLVGTYVLAVGGTRHRAHHDGDQGQDRHGLDIVGRRDGERVVGRVWKKSNDRTATTAVTQTPVRPPMTAPSTTGSTMAIATEVLAVTDLIGTVASATTRAVSMPSPAPADRSSS